MLISVAAAYYIHVVDGTVRPYRTGSHDVMHSNNVHATAVLSRG